MSSRKDNHKVMDMLEKMGMVKKVEDENSLAESMESGPTVQTPGPPAPEPAIARQPEPATVRQPEPAPVPRFEPRFEPRSEPLPARQPVRPEKTYGVSDKVLGKSFWDDNDLIPDESPDTDRFMEVGELYKRFSIKPSGVDTVYLLGEYIRTLPESLPPEMRRSIVLKIVSASGFDFDRLLNDGIDRVSRLNDYSATFATHTEEVVERYNEEIEVLQRQIESIREAINDRKNLHKRQFLEIEGEAQRLKDILDFITK